MIRPATHDDIPGLVAIGEVLVTESPRYMRTSYCPEKVAQMLSACIDNNNALVLVADDNGLIGVCIAVIDSEWFSNDPVAQEMVLGVIPSRRGSAYANAMIEGMTEWARIKGVRYIQAGASTGVHPEATAKLYGRSGYQFAAIGVEKFFH